MSNKRGFTLIETMVVVGIIITLLAWGVPAFSTWKKKHDIESQIYSLYGNLQLARMTAYSRKTVSGVWWTGGATVNSYQVRIDGNNDGDVNDALGTDVQAGAMITPIPPITASAAQTSVSFDGRGFLNPNNAIVFSIPSNTGAAVDCVWVTSTRITTGRMNGANCEPEGRK
ncbi:MAG: GspH/FimT family pseudopilin [Syntrophobacteraceae bacterium]